MLKIAVAMSGGIDSSVTAFLLKQQGYDVIGISAQTMHDESSLQVIQNAKNVADKLEIPFYSLDVSDVFNEKVIKYFKDSYKAGETPNPCIMCNKYMKWGVLFDYAINELNADYIATGHYAKIKCKDGIYKLFPASDEHKDQLYFLFLLDQNHLSKTMFPLSDFHKDRVRQIAYENDLPSKSSKESQDICFIKGKTTTKKYLNDILGSQKGYFIDSLTNRVLGEHNGYWQYTIGQRKGIGLAAPEALYVNKVDSKNNIVYVGYKNTLLSQELKLVNVNWSYPPQKTNFNALIKIRYNMKAVKANVCINNDETTIKFNEPVSAIAQGQACTIYDIHDGHLIGGCFI